MEGPPPPRSGPSPGGYALGMAERDIERGTSSLEREGIPDHEGPLPEKVATGDPQEGLMPPGDEPKGAFEWGVNAREQQLDEPLADRVRREEPELAPQDVALEEEAQTGRLVGADDTDGLAAHDADAEAGSPYLDADLSPEEQAMHTRSEA
jgi:hypothetical protein